MTPHELVELAGFLYSNGLEVSGPLSATPLLGGRSNLTYKLCDQRSTWVLRRPPRSGHTPSAHDMTREWTVMSGLQDGPVPVPRTLAADLEGRTLGYPFTVVSYVDGRVLRRAEDLKALSDAEVRATAAVLVDTLARLHGADHLTLGLDGFGRPEGFLTRQLNLWRRQWDLVKPGELPDLDRLASVLADHLPAWTLGSIVHGDFRIDNTILSAQRPAVLEAVVDWELSTIGDPLTDAALMCAYRQPEFDLVLGFESAWTSPRLPGPDELAEHYSAASSRELAHWPFYQGLANLKLAVITAGIAHRARQEAVRAGESGSAERITAGGPDLDDLYEACRAFVATGLRRLTESPA